MLHHSVTTMIILQHHRWWHEQFEYSLTHHGQQKHEQFEYSLTHHGQQKHEQFEYSLTHHGQQKSQDSVDRVSQSGFKLGAICLPAKYLTSRPNCFMCKYTHIKQISILLCMQYLQSCSSIQTTADTLSIQKGKSFFVVVDFVNNTQC